MLDDLDHAYGFCVANFFLLTGTTWLMKLGEKEPNWPSNRGAAVRALQKKDRYDKNENGSAKAFFLLGTFLHSILYSLSSERDWALNRQFAIYTGISYAVIGAGVPAIFYYFTQSIPLTLRSFMIKAAFIAAAHFPIIQAITYLTKEN